MFQHNLETCLFPTYVRNSGKDYYNSVQSFILRGLCKNLEIYETTILHVILYGCEGWSLTLRRHKYTGIYRFKGDKKRSNAVVIFIRFQFSLQQNFFGFYVITAVTMKSTVFLDDMPCSPVEVHRCFEGMYCRRVSQTTSKKNAKSRMSRCVDQADDQLAS
jgi:hypothetical protein